MGRGQILCGGSANSGQCIEIARHPAVVGCNQLRKERAGIAGRNAYHAAPYLRGARHHRRAVAYLEHASIEIEHVRVDLQLSGRGLLAKGFGCRAIQVRKSEIQAAKGGIGKKGVDEVRLAAAPQRRHPVSGVVEYRYRRRFVRKLKAMIGAEVLLELRQWEGRVNRQK